VKDNRDVVPYAYINLALGITTDLSHLGIGETATVIPDGNGICVIRFSNPKYPEISLGIGQELHGNGIIIYRSEFNVYEVYDITCTFQAQTDYCRLERHPDYDGVFDCPCCKSRFIYNADGFYAIEGPAAQPLKRYPSFIQSGDLVISN
jgi:Rieske Fe-S protein